MTDIAGWLDEIRLLLSDPLSVARDAAASGQLVIGYVSRDVPVELILASHACPVRLRGLTEGNTSAADCYLETAFTPESRSICEQWLSGDLDFIDSVIFPRSQDAAQRLYYYLCELQRCGRAQGPTPLMFDVATIARSSSFNHTVAATKELARSLQTEASAIHASIARHQERIAIVEQLSAARVANLSLRGSDAFSIRCAADLDWRESFDDHLAHYIKSAPRFATQTRLLFAGNVPPDTRFHAAVERAGGNIVCELVEHLHTGTIKGPDILADIALRHHGATTLAQQMQASSTLLVEATREAGAHGVILWAIEEDETLPWEISRQAAALRRAGIPLLLLSRQSWLADDAVLDEVGRFVNSLCS